MDVEKIGAFICQRRQESNLSQQELADKIGVTNKAISKWERGKGLPDISLLEPLAKALNISVTELLNGELIVNATKEQADSAIIQATEHSKRRQRRTVGALFTILGAVMMLAAAVSMFGQWLDYAFALGLIAVATGIILIISKNSLAYCKVSKPVAQWISFGALVLTVILEALPYGAVLVFAPAPEERLRELYSYFNPVTFGYANFFPLITAALTVLLTALSLVLILVKRKTVGLRTAQFVTLVVTATLSVCPLFYGHEYITIIGIAITSLLVLSAVFCSIANAKINLTNAKP